MKYIATAIGQLAFAWKLYNYGLDGRINRHELDIPITFHEGNSVLVLPDQSIDTDGDLIHALANNVTITFGAAAITLNRCREEAGLALPDPIVTDIDQFCAVVYQIRNAFAHDIAEPRWNITSNRYIRLFEFDGIRIDLRSVGNKIFEYDDIGGPETLFQLYEFGSTRVWP